MAGAKQPGPTMLPLHHSRRGQGFTLIEFLIAVTIMILGALLAICISRFNSHQAQQKVNLAINDLRTLDNKIQSYKVSNNAYPAALTDVPMANILDPWGNAYEYFRIKGGDIKGKKNFRKHKNLVPINSDFDLYSQGADGKTVGPLTASAGRDDVVRGNDGRYFGLASNY